MFDGFASDEAFIRTKFALTRNFAFAWMKRVFSLTKNVKTVYVI